MNQYKILIYLLIAAVVGLICFQIVQFTNKPKYAYVNMHEMFENFQMKKEMEKKFEETKSARQKILDSLVFELQLMSRKIEAEPKKNEDDVNSFSLKRDNYLTKKKQVDEDNQSLTEKYNAQIISQMKQYVKDFGTQNHYSIILGDDNNGIVMFSEADNDVTKKVTQFINDRYEGK